MDTPSPDSRRPLPWPHLTDHARQARPPAIDVRAAVRAAIAAERSAPPVHAPLPVWSDALLELFAQPWTRLFLAGGITAALVLCTLSWRSLSQEMSDPIAIALQQDSTGLFSFYTP